jgi:hypothetical protein
MAGALVGLADSRIGSVDNPSGLPMTLDSTGLQLSGSESKDGLTQSYASIVETRSAVLTAGLYPWGFALASWSPHAEGDSYQLPSATPGAGGRSIRLDSRTQEYRLSGSRVFCEDRLSFGLSLIMGRHEEILQAYQGPRLARSAWAYGLAFGGLYQLPHRFLLGLSFTPSMRYGLGDGDDGTGDPAALPIADFFQAAEAPWRLGLGMGWVPSRIFRGALGVYAIGSTPGTALLGNDQRVVGNDLTLQPRVGFSYVAAEYKEFRVELEAGTYVEVMREADAAARLHATVGLELKPWIFSLGWGLDSARDYQNFIFSGGIDVAKVLRKLDMIPPEPRYTVVGMLPSARRDSDEGLPRALVKNWRPDRPPQTVSDVVKVGIKMPSKLRDHVLNAPEEMEKLSEDVLDAIGDLPSDIENGSLEFIKRGVETFSAPLQSGEQDYGPGPLPSAR